MTETLREQNDRIAIVDVIKPVRHDDRRGRL